MKKRSFLILAAAGLLMLAGCNKKPGQTSESGSASGTQSNTSSEGSSQGSSQGGGGEDAGISATEGKITFYFTLGSTSVEVPSYCDIYLTGGFYGQSTWPTAIADVVTMSKLAGSDNIYVGLLDEAQYVATADKANEFQLTMGYNASSGAPATGVNWNYKSSECKAAGGDAGLDNLSFEVVEGVANLGTHTWEEMPPDPAASAIHNLTIEAKFSAAVPEYVDLYLVGDHLAWTFDASTKLTPNADRTSFTQTIDTILGNTYGVKLMAQYAGEATDWNHAVLSDGDNNYSMMVKKTWGDNHTLDLAAQAYENYYLDTETFVIDWAVFMPELGDEVSVGVKLTSAVALDGEWEVRGSWDASWGVPVALTANEGKTEFTADLGQYAGGATIKFKAKLVGTWKVTVGDAEGADITINVGEEAMTVVIALDADLAAEVNGKVALYGTDGESMSDYTAHAAISGNGSAPAFVPADHTWGVIGIANDWDNDIPMVANAGNTEWSADIVYDASTTLYGFHIRADGEWNIEYGNLYLAENPGTEATGNIVLADGNYNVKLSFTAELTPVITITALA